MSKVKKFHASEKLAELDEAMPGDWKRLSPGAPLIEGPFASVQALCALRNALPALVDLVAAVERYERQIGYDPVVYRDVATAMRDLRGALAQGGVLSRQMYLTGDTA